MPSYPTHHLSVVTWADTRDTLEKRRGNFGTLYPDIFSDTLSLNTKTVKAKKISGNIALLSYTLRVSGLFRPNTN